MSEKLKKYQEKRDFVKTSEPKGKPANGKQRKKKGLKFVVQYHAARTTHFDFRLEWQGVLLSWAVPKGPSYNPKDKRLAVHVEDHPVEYADFEGAIPKGEYGGGTVMLWDEGAWEPQEDFEEGLKKGSLKFKLSGERLHGKWALVRMAPRENESAENWLLIKEKDEFAAPGTGISDYDTSVRSGRKLEKIAAEESSQTKVIPFQNLSVHLARSVDKLPQEDGWAYEIKYDGYRILAYAEDGSVKLMTRGGHDYAAKFKSVAKALETWSKGRSMVLDGEMIIADENGKSDFQALQNYLKKPTGKELTFIVFDLLAADGKDLRALPLSERKSALEKLMKGAPASVVYSKHTLGNGEEIFQAAAKIGLEGIVGKKLDSRYSGTRNGDWIKMKCYNRQEFVIGGYQISEKKAGGIGALLLGVYEGRKLIFAGRAGTGFGQRDAESLLKKFDKLRTEISPFKTAPEFDETETVFLKPRLVAEVQFAEWTDENVLRQASFKGLRTDKKPTEVVRETPLSEKDVKSEPKRETKKEATVLGIPVSSPDKIVFKDPEVKKLEIAQYYAAVAKRMMPYAGGRVLSVVRCHKGVSAACFFKKHPVSEGEGTAILEIENSEGEKSDYFYLKDERGLISEAQLGTLEFHVWGSRADDLERPDMMIFDLDPDEGMGLDQIRQGVRDLKKVLDSLSLQSFLKTSGGKGYHVVVPFRPTAEWDAFRDFSRQVAQLMEKKWPERYTSNVRKIKRKGKIYIDWVRNGRGATSVAPYSLRARPGAHVSMPIAWRELSTVAPDGVDMFDALKRLKKADPWKGFFQIGQQLQI